MELMGGAVVPERTDHPCTAAMPWLWLNSSIELTCANLWLRLTAATTERRGWRSKR